MEYISSAAKTSFAWFFLHLFLLFLSHPVSSFFISRKRSRKSWGSKKGSLQDVSKCKPNTRCLEKHFGKKRVACLQIEREVESFTVELEDLLSGIQFTMTELCCPPIDGLAGAPQPVPVLRLFPGLFFFVWLFF